MHTYQLTQICFAWVFLLAASATMAATPAKRVVFDIPRLEHITVDGDGQDWGTQGFCVNAMHDLNQDGGDTPRQARSAVTMRMGWDARGLLLLVRVVDVSPLESDYIGTLWQRDSIEVFMTTALGGKDGYQLVLAPGVDGKHAEIRQCFYDRRETDALKAVPLSCTLARTRTADGYQLEALLPWSNLGVTPALAREVCLQVVVNDFDTQGALWHKAWYPQTGTAAFSDRMYTVRLADAASEPTDLQTYCYHERFRRIVVSATDDVQQAGKMLTVRAGRRILGRAPMVAANGQSKAEVLLPFTPNSPPYPVLNAGIDDHRFLLDPAPIYFEREKAILRLSVAGSASVFTGTGFPNVDFTDPALAENLLGRYTLQTTYYDAGYRQVSSADSPGRYGALVEITPDHSAPFHRYLTLYRLAANMDAAKQGELFQALLTAMGQDLRVTQAQLPSLERLRRQVLNGMSRQPEIAVALAGLSEMTPGSAPATDRTGCESRDANWWYGLRQRLGITETYPYVVLHPDGYGKDTTMRYPLIISLHGSGDSEANFATFKTHPVDKGLAGFTRSKYPAIVVAPFSQMGGWSPQMVDALLSEMLAKEPIDPDRVYLTGLSMGGFGSWRTAAAYPERYAAIVPIAGGGDTRDAAPLKNLPIWAFHGEADDVVNVSLSKNMVQAITDAGGQAKLTLYPGVGHWSWGIAYADPALYDWLFQQRRKHD